MQWWALQRLKAKDAQAGRFVSWALSTDASVPSLQPQLKREIAANGSLKTRRAAVTALTFLEARNDRCARNLFTAFLRMLAFVDRPGAIEFGETFLLRLHDKRAIHSLVKFCLGEKMHERGLQLLQMLPKDEWHDEMCVKLVASQEAEVLSREIDSVVGTDGGLERITELAADYLERASEQLTALQFLFHAIQPMAKQHRILTDLVLHYGEALAATGHTSDQLAIHMCDAHLYKGEVDQALDVVHRLAAGESDRIGEKHQRLLSVKRLLEHGFQYEISSTHDGYVSLPKRVLCPLHNSLPFDSGGYATRTHGLLTSILTKGWQVSGVTRLGYPQDRPRHKNTAVESFSEIDDIQYFRLQREHCVYGGRPLYEYLCRYADELYELAKQEQPSVIHAPANFMNGVAANAVAKALGIKSIYEVRGLWEITRISRQPEWEDSQYFTMMRNMELQAAQDADAVICITSALKEEMVVRGVPPEKISIIPNGVDVGRFVPRPANELLKKTLGFSGKKVIGYIGSIVDYEGLDYLIEAVAALDAKGIEQEFSVLIVGDGAALEGIRELSDAHGLSDRIVKFTGRVPHEEVEDYYSIIDIAPFPRKSLPVTEMVSPLKPFEAMAMNKIVLSSDVAALAEIVEEGVNGHLFEKDNVEDLALQLERLLSYGSVTSMKPREWVIQNRSWDKITETLDELYRTLTSDLEQQDKS